MTNYEHMTDEEKKLAIVNGIHITKNGNIGICPVTNQCRRCKGLGYDTDCCYRSDDMNEKEEWLNAEYKPQHSIC